MEALSPALCVPGSGVATVTGASLRTVLLIGAAVKPITLYGMVLSGGESSNYGSDFGGGHGGSDCGSPFTSATILAGSSTPSPKAATLLTQRSRYGQLRRPPTKRSWKPLSRKEALSGRNNESFSWLDCRGLKVRSKTDRDRRCAGTRFASRGKCALLHSKWRKLIPLSVDVQRHPSVCYRAEVYSNAFRCKRYRTSQPCLP